MDVCLSSARRLTPYVHIFSLSFAHRQLVRSVPCSDPAGTLHFPTHATVSTTLTPIIAPLTDRSVPLSL